MSLNNTGVNVTTLETNRLAKMLSLLGSEYPGERDAAALAADRMVKALGVSWSDLLSQSSYVPYVPRTAHPT